MEYCKDSAEVARRILQNLAFSFSGRLLKRLVPFKILTNDNEYEGSSWGQGLVWGLSPGDKIPDRSKQAFG